MAIAKEAAESWGDISLAKRTAVLFKFRELVASHVEDARAQAAYGVHSGVNKVLIINRDWVPGRVTVVLCDEALGF